MFPIPIYASQNRITNTLLLRANSLDNIGIMHGKMGIAIYFFHLARIKKCTLYEDFAFDLVEEIYEKANSQSPRNLENGLAGIGVGIEYLVENKFIKANTNEVLEEIDNEMIKDISYSTLNNISILRGIGSYILYFFYRLKSFKGNTQKSEELKSALNRALVLLDNHIDFNRTSIEYNKVLREPEKFDITWNYTSVLWLLAELVDFRLLENEVVQILSKILSLMECYNIYPQLHSNRLLLCLAVERLKSCKKNVYDGFYFNWLIFKLLDGIDRNLIKRELVLRSPFLRDGTLGISLIYLKLYELTQNSFFYGEFEYWKSYGFELLQSYQGCSGFQLNKNAEKEDLGLLNGLGGIALMLIKFF